MDEDAVPSVKTTLARFDRRLNLALIAVGTLCLIAGTLYLRIKADTGPAVAPSASAEPATTGALGPVRLGANNTVVNSAGQSVPLCTGVLGFFDGFHLENQQLVAKGWAMDQSRARPVVKLLLFVNGRLLGQGKPGVSRPDVASALNLKSAEQSGFALVVPLQGTVIQPTDRIRIFATDDRTCAVEVPLNR